MNLLDLIQVEVTNYFPKLINKLTELGQETVSIIQPENSLKQIQFIFTILDEVLKVLKDLNQQYAQLEECLQNYEGQCRDHIRTEQRLKLYCENVQDLYDQQISIEKDYKYQIHNYQKEITLLKKELNESQNLRRDKNHLENSKQTIVLENKYRSSIFQNGFQNQTFAIKLNNRKNRSITETQEILTKSKQSMDERQYQLSLDKTQEMIINNARPKSRMNPKQKSMTLQLTSINKGNIIKKS
ncbi:unnamed protein product [Paramecium pentaurelia]|uniref:Uncharacterized protein n=1 Tax=Paramecium pentaurelia TaxID=43138 RepID=A0A8S1WMU7_9CILI|nr:unnamed protein product [Paramecium pentaurelia]